MPITVKPLVSLIMPCLNEEKTLALCINTAIIVLKKQKLPYEIIIVDNGSSDRSFSIAGKLNVKSILEKRKGYGRALLKGIAKAEGQIIIMADCDGSYDLKQIPQFIKKIKSGSDLVLGSRFKGHIKEKAMPAIRRYIGNPLLTLMLNLFYNAKLSDAQTGYRAFTKKAFIKLGMRSKGMEFASEMIIKAIYHQIKIAEVPINYYPRGGQSKLSPVTDALRHIKYMLLYSPTYTFIIPGLFLLLTGFILSLLLLPGPRIILGWNLDIHTMTNSILLANLGLQLILLGIFARTYSQEILDLPPGPLARLFLNLFPSPRLLLIGLMVFFIGFLIVGSISFNWIISGYPSLSKVREIVFAFGLMVSGTQFVFSSLLLSLIKEEI